MNPFQVRDLGSKTTFKTFNRFVPFNRRAARLRSRRFERVERFERLEREQSDLRSVGKIPSGPELNALIAERVMGWRNVERRDGRYWGQKQDKAGRWRRTAVRNYCKNPTDAYLIDEQIKQLGLLEKYRKELTKITRAKKIPVEWASPNQRCRAALKTVKK